MPPGQLVEPFRLPSEGEWEYAARTGKNENKFPWSTDELQDSKGCFLGNFKPGKGNYTEDGHFISTGTLKALEEKLSDCPFARCNSGYLVNLAQVSGVQQNEVQVGPYQLQISRPKRKSFLAALADYIGGEGI